VATTFISVIFLLLLTKICWVHFASLFCCLNQSTRFYKDLLIYSFKYQTAYSVFVYNVVPGFRVTHIPSSLAASYGLCFLLCCAVYKIHCVGIWYCSKACLNTFCVASLSGCMCILADCTTCISACTLRLSQWVYRVPFQKFVALFQIFIMPCI
jgi:hypothetical protein